MLDLRCPQSHHLRFRGHPVSPLASTKAYKNRFFRSTADRRAERDISADLRGALVPVVTKNHAAITESVAIGQLLRAIDGYRGQPVTHAALKLAPLVFVRPGELRQVEWSEINLESGEWRIPAERMKMRELHIVPLARQAIEILRGMLPLTGRSRFVFPSLRTNDRPISENTIVRITPPCEGSDTPTTR